MEEKLIKKLYSKTLAGLSYNEFKEMLEDIYENGRMDGYNDGHNEGYRDCENEAYERGCFE